MKLAKYMYCYNGQLIGIYEFRQLSPPELTASDCETAFFN